MKLSKEEIDLIAKKVRSELFLDIDCNTKLLTKLVSICGSMYKSSIKGKEKSIADKTVSAFEETFEDQRQRDIKFYYGNSWGDTKNRKTCSTCKWFKSAKYILCRPSDGLGMCHKNAPTSCGFADVLPSDKCGEWEAID